MEMTELQTRIIEFMSEQLDSPQNTINMNGEPAWDNFLLGAAAGDDPIFGLYKEAVGPEHYTPLELFRAVFPDAEARADELSVLCWILPQRGESRSAEQDAKLPTERWARVKQFGEVFYNEMGANLEKFFAALGIPAVYPMGRPDIVKRAPSGKYRLVSNWSERHACFAAGLGTFGLCDGLITPLGKAHRCGSIVVKARIPATLREYSDPHEYCPWFTKHSCGLCAKRCPAGAISETGHNKELCKAYMESACAEYLNGLGLTTHACGLCQTKVPCEDRIPGRARPELYRTFLPKLEQTA